MEQVPIPRDIPLPLPLPESVLQILIVVSFLVHILFVNFMLGGAIFVLIYQIKGLYQRQYDQIAREIAATITINKSLAVVLGVAPLLLINTLYSIYFYTANVLTGYMWIMIIPLVTAAFLLLYGHKYAWDRMAAYKKLHIALLAAAIAIFLFVPLIFLANINLMLFPSAWLQVKGFFSALWVGNVVPRYLHFLAASIAVMGLFLVGYFRRAGYPWSQKFPHLQRDTLLREFYIYPVIATVLQFVLGPLVLFTLPEQGVDLVLIAIFIVGGNFGALALMFMGQEISQHARDVGRNLIKIVPLLAVTVCIMGAGRHMYRENAVQPHRQAMAKKSASFAARSQHVLEQRLAALPDSQTLDLTPREKLSVVRHGLSLGQLLNPQSSIIVKSNGSKVYQTYCAACHGSKGMGGGAIKSRDLTQKAGWKNGTKVTDIMHTLSTGIPGTSMVSFKSIDIEKRFAVAHYVTTLGKFERPRISKNDIEQLRQDYPQLDD